MIVVVGVVVVVTMVVVAVVTVIQLHYVVVGFRLSLHYILLLAHFLIVVHWKALFSALSLYFEPYFSC